MIFWFTIFLQLSPFAWWINSTDLIGGNDFEIAELPIHSKVCDLQPPTQETSASTKSDFILTELILNSSEVPLKLPILASILIGSVVICVFLFSSLAIDKLSF